MSVVILVGKDREAPFVVRFDNETEQARLLAEVTRAGKIISTRGLFYAEQALEDVPNMPKPVADKLALAAARHEVGTSVKSCASGFAFKGPPLGQRLINKFSR